MENKNINYVTNHITSIKDGKNEKKGVCVFLGAGADISSGGILFRDLKIKFLTETGREISHDITDKKLDDLFEKQVNQFTQSGRCETLEKIMGCHKTPTEGYELLVLLANLGYINAIITTNFDYLLEETENLMNINPFTIFAPGMSIPDNYYLQRNSLKPVYLKMHGDLYGRMVTHLTKSEIETKPYGKKFIDLMEHIIINNSIIMIGYGGYDALITQIFQKNINNISPVFWCNINKPQEDSELSNLLKQHDKLYFVQGSFDYLIQNISLKLLQKEKMLDSNPVFLPTLIKAKSERQQSLFSSNLMDCEYLIERNKVTGAVEKKLSDFNTKLIGIRGGAKCGKSSFIYKFMQSTKDILFIPIMGGTNPNIMENMALALGYKTDVPFSLMFNFSSWCNKQRKQVVFVLDGIFTDDYICDANFKYIIELCNFLHVTKEFNYVQFLVTFQQEAYYELLKSPTLKVYANLFVDIIEMTKFSDIEVEKMMKKNNILATDISEDNYELLHEPYIWNILKKNGISLKHMFQKNFYEQYSEFLYSLIGTEDRFTKYALMDTMKSLAYNEVFNNVAAVDTLKLEYRFLVKQGVVDTKGHYVYKKFAIHYCAEYLAAQNTFEDIIDNIIIPKFQKEHDICSAQMETFSIILSKVKNIGSFTTIFSGFEKILDKQSCGNANKLIILALTRLVKENEELFETYIFQTDINQISLNVQQCIFRVCAENKLNILSIWLEMEEPNILSYEAFIMRNDFLYAELRHNKCSQNVFQRIADILANYPQKKAALFVLHLLSYCGWDNMEKTEYEIFVNMYKSEILPMLTILDTNDIQYITNKLSRYSYNFFFNAGDDLEEKFSNMIYNNRLLELVQEVLKGRELSCKDYQVLMQLCADYNDCWTFIVANMIVVCSMKNNFIHTYNMLLEIPNLFGENLEVEQLDFYLSSVFWALYIQQPYDRKKFVTIFERIVTQYETLLFEFPKNRRYSTMRKFKDEFDLVFEDGFNPVAFYFYTAPFKCLALQKEEWNAGDKQLEIYWILAKNINESGNYGQMLRLVHALGQMISIYPNEGYEALEKLSTYNHSVIKKAVIRILKEYYVRYNTATENFIKNTKFELDENEIENIVFHTNLLMQNRTFEQLHWSRIFYNFEHIFNKNPTELFLKNIINSTSYGNFFKKFFRELFND